MSAEGVTRLVGKERRTWIEVWLLWFERERVDGGDTELLIRVYRTEDIARAAIQRIKGQPGSREYPESFTVHERVLDKDSWTEGFVRV